MLTAILNFIYSFFGFTRIEAQPIDITTDNWKFQTGDDSTWATPQYNDQNWQPIEVGKQWEAVIAGYDGFGWYRKTIVLDSRAMRRAVRCKGSLVLRLGKIDDADETFFNGVKIGETGQMPPNAQTAWDIDRVYFIPKKLIKWRKQNVIAVRVHDSGGGGGIAQPVTRSRPPSQLTARRRIYRGRPSARLRRKSIFRARPAFQS